MTGRQLTGGGRVLLYANEILGAESVEILQEFPEHVWCQIRSSSNTKLSNKIFGVIYRTPNETIYTGDLHTQLRGKWVRVMRLHSGTSTTGTLNGKA